MLLKHLPGIVCPFALPNGAEARPFGSQIQATDPSEQGQMGQFRHHGILLERQLGIVTFQHSEVGLHTLLLILVDECLGL